MKHGTRYNYQAGCRCSRCRRANRRYKAQWKGQASAKKVTDNAIRSFDDLRRFETMHGLPLI